MRVQAQVSIYPLRTKALTMQVREFCHILEDSGLYVEMQSMSSIIIGESKTVFLAVEQAFRMLAVSHDVVMDLKVSNACPDINRRRPRKREKKTQ